MRDYAIMRARFWTQGTGRELCGDRAAREMALYLMSCPSSNMLGLYYLPMSLLMDELGYDSPGDARAVLRRVEDTGFCRYDDASREVFVLNMAKEQVGERLQPKDKRILGIERELAKWTRSRFYNAFLERYREPYRLRMMPVVVELPDDLSPEEPAAALGQAPSEPHRSQDQDQEQVQAHDQDQERERASAPAAGEAERETTDRPREYPPLEIVKLDRPPPEPEREPGEPEPPSWRDTEHMVRVLFERRYTEARTVPPGWSRNNLAHVKSLALSLDKLRGDREKLFCRMLDAFFADAWAINHGFPLGALASDPAKYLAPPQQTATAKERKSGFMPPSPGSAFKRTNLDSLFGTRVEPGAPCRT
jgi:hypothetical protein